MPLPGVMAPGAEPIKGEAPLRNCPPDPKGTAMRKLTLVALALALIAPAGATAASWTDAKKPKASWTDSSPTASWTDAKAQRVVRAPR